MIHTAWFTILEHMLLCKSNKRPDPTEIQAVELIIYTIRHFYTKLVVSSIWIFLFPGIPALGSKHFILEQLANLTTMPSSGSIRACIGLDSENLRYVVKAIKEAYFAKGDGFMGFLFS